MVENGWWWNLKDQFKVNLVTEHKEELVKELKDSIFSEIKSYISTQCETIKKLIDNVEKHESTIAVLHKLVENLKNENSNLKMKLENDINQIEQYSRRQTLRIDGVEVSDNFESPENVVSLVHGYMKEVGINNSDMVIDRAHRIGPVYKDKNNVKYRSIIVKFTNFRIRTQFYRSRGKLKDKIKIRIDLTKRNYNVLKKSIDLIYESEKKDVYVFADINCRLKIVDIGSKEESFINSIDDAKYFLSQSMGSN